MICILIHSSVHISMWCYTSQDQSSDHPQSFVHTMSEQTSAHDNTFMCLFIRACIYLIKQLIHEASALFAHSKAAFLSCSSP